MYHENSIEALKDLIVSEGEFDITPYPQDEIQNAIDHYGKLPQILIDYYRLIGKISDSVMNVIAPNKLVAQKDNEFISVTAEYCGMLHVAVHKNDLDQENPKCYLGGEMAYSMLEDCDLEGDGSDFPEPIQREHVFYTENEDLYIDGEVYPDDFNEDQKGPYQNLLTSLNDCYYANENY